MAEQGPGTMMAMRTLPLRPWTADEYGRMVAAGVLGEDDRVELIEGEIVQMTPVGARHAASVKSLARVLQLQVGDRLVVSVQDPIRLSPRSEPQPDLAVLTWRDDYYRDELPGPADVLLAIEVAESSVVTEREVKLPLYGRSGIPESWLVDLVAGTIEIYRSPSPTGYLERSVHRPGATVSPQGIEGLEVSVVEALVTSAS